MFDVLCVRTPLDSVNVTKWIICTVWGQASIECLIFIFNFFYTFDESSPIVTWSVDQHAHTIDELTKRIKALFVLNFFQSAKKFQH